MKPLMDSASKAREWYYSQALSGFAGKTARDLVAAGSSDEVLEFIDAVGAGIHA